MKAKRFSNGSFGDRVMAVKKKPLVFTITFVFYLVQFNYAQNGYGFTHAKGTSLIHPRGDDSLSRKIRKHEDLETELELYPLNLIRPGDPVVKNEAMFDYHLYSNNEKLLGGVRFFADANTHYESSREMKDLIMYTEGYFGYKYFQIGAEVGSITGEEYLSIGPQITAYDNLIFKRVSIISRIVPDYVLGYEYTTQELKLFHVFKLSSTGMGRIALTSKQMVIQASAWISLEKLKGVFFGVEYEYNNATYFNNNKFEVNNELFFGVKFELF